MTGAPEPDGWITAASAAALFATDPTGTGGVHLRALPGPVREAWTTMLRALLGPELPYRRVPAHIRDDRLLGGLDLTATLQTGRPIAQRGVLAEADGGVIELPMAERMDTALAARITSVLDAGEVVLERDGIASRTATRFGVVAVDEGISDDERPPPALLDRLAFVVDLIDLSWRDTDTTLFDPQQIAAARARRARVQCPAEMTEALTGTALALGVWSLRPTQLAVRVARAAAALDGRDEVNRDDVTLAARLVLAPRATRLPAPPPDADEATEEQPAEPPENEDERTDPPPPPEDDDERESPNTEQVQELGEVVLEAATASIPAELLMKLSQAAGPRTSAGQGGKSGASQRSKLRGRPVGVERGDPATGARLSVLDTLRAAAPWQRVRASTAGEQAAGVATGSPRRIAVRGEDFRVVRFRQNAETTTIFAVDASGSAAINRLAEAKGAIELLLADCYVRRDQVALIAFRGRGAELLLPPTRSLVRAKRELAALPAGGGTPLAAGLDAARALAEQIQRQGNTPMLVLLTDGRANVARDGSGGREAAHADAIASARTLRELGISTVIIDMSRRPQVKAQEVAEQMNGRYLLLPSADAATLSNAVRALQ